MEGVGGEEGNTHGNDIDVGGILVVGQTKTRFQVCAFYILKYSIDSLSFKAKRKGSFSVLSIHVHVRVGINVGDPADSEILPKNGIDCAF